MRVFKTFLVGIVIATGSALAQPAQPASDITAQNVKIQGSLDLENGVPIRWKKPDGSGYVNIFTLDKNGTLQLCHDAFFYDQEKPEKTKTKDPAERERRRKLEEQHNFLRVIEVKNPNSNYPDLRLPFTRTQGKNDIADCDAQLVVRSASFLETNDPPELNFIRTGNDQGPVNDENAPVQDGSITGIVRFMGRCDPVKAKDPRSGIGTDAEILGRNYGTSEKDHWGGMFFLVKDNRLPNATDSSGVMALMTPGVRIARMARSPGEGKTGAVLEVDSHDDRPVIFRRTGASTTQPVALALATGANGAVADASNSLALIKALRVGSPDSVVSRVEIQTNKGNKLESDWVLPVPAASASSNTAQEIASGEMVVLAFNQTARDTDSMRSESEATRLTCRTSGQYAVSAAVEFAANAKGTRQVIVRKNGREQMASMRVAPAAEETTQIVFTAPLIDLAPGDYVELLVRQTSGQTLVVGKQEVPVKFSIVRVG